jgi:hypothetical protein
VLGVSEEEAAPAWRRSGPAWILGAVALLLVLVALGAFGGGDDASGPNESAKRADAERVCKEKFIADRLKAPSTAEYDLDVSGGPVTYTVQGTVDSENGFGAMLRSDVTCVVRDDGDKWTLESLTGLD